MVETEVLPNVPDDARREELELDLGTLSRMALREKYWSEANSHKDMKYRCDKEGLGRYVAEWADFLVFLKYMGPKTSPDHTLDRVDPCSPLYGPGTVRWADKKTQTTNRSNTRRTIYHGREVTFQELADELGVPYQTLYSALIDGKATAEEFALRCAQRTTRRSQVVVMSVFRHPDPERDGGFQSAFRDWKARLRPGFKLGHGDTYLYLRATKEWGVAVEKMTAEGEYFGGDEGPTLEFLAAQELEARMQGLREYSMAHIAARDPTMARELQSLTDRMGSHARGCADTLNRAVYTSGEWKAMKSQASGYSGYRDDDDDFYAS